VPERSRRPAPRGHDAKQRAIEDTLTAHQQIVGSQLVNRFAHRALTDLETRGQFDFTGNDLAGFPWASSVDPPALRGVDIPGRFICDNYHILRDAVLQSDLVCICSSSFVAEQLRDGTLREIKVKGLVLPETTIYMAKLRGRVLSPLAEEAVQRVRAHLK